MSNQTDITEALDRIQRCSASLLGELRHFVEQYSTNLVLRQPLSGQAASELASLWERAVDLDFATREACTSKPPSPRAA
jgi:hypothetical protein